MNAVWLVGLTIFILLLASSVEDHRPRKLTMAQAKLDSRKVVEIMQRK